MKAAFRRSMRTWLFAIASLGLVLLHATSVQAQAPDGAAIFAKNCTSCHTGAADTRAPAPDVLRQRSPEAILSALTAGSMRPQGGILSGAERRAVAEYLSGKSLGGDVTGAATAQCGPNAPAPRPGAAWGGWSPASTNARFQTAQELGDQLLNVCGVGAVKVNTLDEDRMQYALNRPKERVETTSLLPEEMPSGGMNPKTALLTGIVVGVTLMVALLGH